MRWLLSLCLFTNVLISKPLDINVQARCAYLIDNATERVLFAKNSEEKCYPASLTKIATGLFVLDQFAPYLNLTCVAKEEALKKSSSLQKKSKNFPPYFLEPDGSSLRLQVGEKAPLKDLLKAMIVASANDAANVIAVNAHGSIPVFMENLNHYLKNIGCQATHFCNPHGLHYPDHVTTAKDLAIIFQKAIKNPLFNEMIQTCHCVFPATNCRTERHLLQTNGLIKKTGKHFCPYVVGGKTGYTQSAGFNLIALATHEKRSLTAVVLNCPTSEARYQDIQKLFDAAFQEKKIMHKVVSANRKFSITLPGAQKPLEAMVKEDCILEYFPSEEGPLRAKIRWNHVNLPIKEGSEVGLLQVTTEKGIVLKEMAVYAQNSVKKTFGKWLKDLL